ncbi:hypothetical protein BDW68DRAFT_164610 [Aspergillus falconensis]
MIYRGFTRILRNSQPLRNQDAGLRIQEPAISIFFGHEIASFKIMSSAAIGEPLALRQRRRPWATDATAPVDRVVVPECRGRFLVKAGEETTSILVLQAMNLGFLSGRWLVVACAVMSASKVHVLWPERSRAATHGSRARSWSDRHVCHIQTPDVAPSRWSQTLKRGGSTREFRASSGRGPSMEWQPDISLVLEATTAPSSSIVYRVGCRYLRPSLQKPSGMAWRESKSNDSSRCRLMTVSEATRAGCRYWRCDRLA